MEQLISELPHQLRGLEDKKVVLSLRQLSTKVYKRLMAILQLGEEGSRYGTRCLAQPNA